MKKSWINFSTILKILNILFFAILLSCQNPQTEKKIETQKKLPDEESDSIKIFSTSNNNIEWELTAAHIKRFYDEQKVYGDTVFIKIYNQDNSLLSYQFPQLLPSDGQYS